MHFPFIFMIGRELSHNKQGCVLGCSWERSCMINHTSTSQFQCKSYSMSLGNGQQNHWIGWDIPRPRIPVPPCKSKISLVVLLWKWFQSEASALTSWVGEHPNISQISVQSSTVKLLLSELFCTAQDLCMGVFLCNPTIQQSSAMQEKKKIIKDQQRSSKISCYKFKSLLPARWYWTIAPRKGFSVPLLKMGWC